jgi:hypothetical protein
MRHAILLQRTGMLALLAWTTGAHADPDAIFRSSFEDGSLIEQIQQNSAAFLNQSVVIGPALVTAIRQTAGNTTFWVQVPPAFAAPDGNYPRYAGIKAFASPALPSLAVGDCVTFNGTVIEFQGATELSPVENLTVQAAGACGAVALTPALVRLEDVATDSDSVTAGPQPGALAEAYEGVLVRVEAVTAVSGISAGAFPVTETQAPADTLDIGTLMFTYNAMAGEQFLSITGVLDQQGTPYRLLPRALGDIQK